MRTPQQDLEQINLPDPIKQELQQLKEEQARMKADYETMKKKLEKLDHQEMNKQ